MSCSERTGRDHGTKEVYRTFLRAHGLEDDWTVRFTANRGRAREMAEQYREAGYEVRVLPLFPEGGPPEPSSPDAPSPDTSSRAASPPETPSPDRPTDAHPGPLGQGETEACAPCLAGMCVLLTRRRSGRGTPAGPGDGLVYE